LERLRNIEHYVKSGADLTRQLLGFARGGKYQVKPLDPNTLIERTSTMFGRTSKGICIHTRLQEVLWPVEADQGQIEQVLLNLYVNAWQAMPKGGDLYIETENATFAEGVQRFYDISPGRYVKISVKDTGVGMDEATRKRIFEPFFTTKEMGRGTGLGLASAYGIIRNHGGVIDAMSEAGKGSTFFIYLPATVKNVTDEELLSEEILRGNETILFVDDESTIADIGKTLLEKMGYRVVIGHSGREAVDLVEKARELHDGQAAHPDLVILDLVMPGISGAETFYRLRELSPDLKILLCSGYSLNDEAKNILQRGCEGFIQKPFTLQALSSKIREVLDGK
jgi:CheY-like chemotaxis protein